MKQEDLTVEKLKSMSDDITEAVSLWRYGTAPMFVEAIATALDMERSPNKALSELRADLHKALHVYYKTALDEESTRDY